MEWEAWVAWAAWEVAWDSKSNLRHVELANGQRRSRGGKRSYTNLLIHGRQNLPLQTRTEVKWKLIGVFCFSTCQTGIEFVKASQHPSTPLSSGFLDQ